MFKSLSPSLLLATPTLTDPNFHQTVVLLFHHTPQGALGLIINRPSGRPMQEVLISTGIDAGDPRAASMPICLGGPVSTESGWVVFEGQDPRGESFVADDDLLVTGSLEVFRRVLAPPEVGRMLFMLGYAGWGPGQLDSEMEEGAWLPVPLNRKTLFETPFDQRWRASFLGLGIDPDLWSMESGTG